MGFNDDSTVLIKQVLDKPSFDPMAFIEVEITTSQTWVAPTAKDNLFYVVIQGAGGSGANSQYGIMIATGGNGGEIKKSWITLTPAESIVVTIGAGGAGVSNTIGSINGNVGGSTTFGSYLTAQGGDKGYSGNRYELGATLKSGISGGDALVFQDSGQTNYYHIHSMVPPANIDVWTPKGAINVTGAKSLHFGGYSTSTYSVGFCGAGGAGLNGVSPATLVGAVVNNSGNVTPAGAGSGGILTAGSTNSFSMTNTAGGTGIVKIYYEAI